MTPLASLLVADELMVKLVATTDMAASTYTRVRSVTRRDPRGGP